MCLFSSVVVVLVSSLRVEARIVINEVHYHPLNKTRATEFIELFNDGKETVDLSGWHLRKAVRYEFPTQTLVPAGGYVVIAQDPEVVALDLALKGAHGPWRGKLSNEGDKIMLESADDETVDEVNYGAAFPWPLVGGEMDASIELIHPDLDNDLGGSWRPSALSPGERNHTFAESAPPQIRQVKHVPREPTSSKAVTITAKITDPQGVGSVTLDYQIVDPGDYFTRFDRRYRSTDSWTKLKMHDDGTGEFAASIPASVQTHRRLVRYRLTATDRLGEVITAPYEYDPEANFAYYVYDAVPAWTAPPQADGESRTFSNRVLTKLPIYHFLAKSEDVQEGQHGGYRGSDYLWHGTLVVDGEVYDHLGFRARGGTWRYNRGKNFWKFNFHRGHRFQARDPYGMPYKIKWDKLNFGSCFQNTSRNDHQGEQGLYEAVTFALFNLAGVEAPLTHYVHFRVVDSVEETTPDPYVGDFQGLYLAIEQPDGRFLDQHDLPDGNLYKIEFDEGDKGNQGPTQALDNRDFETFRSGYQSQRGNRRWLRLRKAGPDSKWWEQNLDLERYFSYRTIVEATHHYDIGHGKNYYYYHNPETDKWQVHPWDVDLTWADDQFGSGDHLFSSAVLNQPEFRPGYFNRVQELLDLLFNEEQTGQLIDHMAQFIHDPETLDFAEADAALWNRHPENNHPGLYYQRPARKGRAADVSGFITEMKAYIDHRRRFLSRQVSREAAMAPKRPVLKFQGPDGFPIDQLTFHCSKFESSDTIAMKWRLAEAPQP